MKIFFILLFCQAQSLFAIDKVAEPENSMPPGYEDVYMGMPLKDFLKTHKEIKSCATFFEKLIDGKWLIDPDNPQKLNWGKQDHCFKERSHNRVFNSNTRYLFFSQRLDGINWDGEISASSTVKWRDASKELIHYVIDKWGGADKIWLVENKRNETGYVYYLVLYCKRGGGLNLIVRVPVKWESYCSRKRKMGKYWCMLKEKLQRNLAFSMTIEIANRQEKDIFGRSDNILSKADQDKMLKETGNFEILKQAMDKHKK